MALVEPVVRADSGDARATLELGLAYEDLNRVAAARAHLPDDAAIPVVVAATAHPGKFPDAVERATGLRPALPAHLAGLLDRPERFTVARNDLAAIQALVRGTALRNAA